MKRLIVFLCAAWLLCAAPVHAQQATPDAAPTPAASVTIPITVDPSGNISVPSGAPFNAALLAVAAGALVWMARNGFGLVVETRRVRLKQALDDSETDNKIDLSQVEQTRMLVEALAESSKQQERQAERHNQLFQAFNTTLAANVESQREIATLVKALNARSEYLITNGQKLDQGLQMMTRLLTEGKTSTLTGLEKKMDDELKPIEKRLEALEQNSAETLRLLRKLAGEPTPETEATPETKPAPTPAAQPDIPHSASEGNTEATP